MGGSEYSVFHKENGSAITSCVGGLGNSIVNNENRSSNLGLIRSLLRSIRAVFVAGERKLAQTVKYLFLLWLLKLIVNDAC